MSNHATYCKAVLALNPETDREVLGNNTKEEKVVRNVSPSLRVFHSQEPILQRAKCTNFFTTGNSPLTHKNENVQDVAFLQERLKLLNAFATPMRFRADTKSSLQKIKFNFRARE